jgi:hypothetical protein
MGVTGLWKLIETSGKPVPLETLEGKVLAVGKNRNCYFPLCANIVKCYEILQILAFGCIKWLKDTKMEKVETFTMHT